MIRIRTAAALAAAVLIAACADAPTAVDRAAPAGPLASSSTCAPYLGGATAVNSDSTYSYRLYYNGNDCSITTVTWAVYGGTIMGYAGYTKAYVKPNQTTCMQVDATAHHSNGTKQTFTLLVNVNGYTGTCYHLA